jgi:uncharacterized repeat protein (TIGR01451 family)
MRHSPSLVGALALVLALPLSAAKLDDGELRYFNVDSARQRHLTLRSTAGDVQIVDDSTGQIVASAPTGDVRKVIIRGASGAHDDQLTVDLSTPFDLPGGIDFDGGAGGFDTLVMTGGNVGKQTLRQQNTHAGTFAIGALAVRYSNLEPLVDTAAAATLVVTGTAGNDTVTISSAGSQMTISSPSFESYTFENKTEVTFDGGGGTDTVVWTATTPATGLTTFHLTGIDSITQTSAIAVQRFSASATGAITLNNAGNDVDNVELQSVNGSIQFTDADALTIGGVDPALGGVHVTTSGSVTVIANGTLTLADSNGIDVVSSGSSSGLVDLQAIGAASDIVGGANRDAVTSPGGSITLDAGRDILLGTGGADWDNDVRARGSVTLRADRIVQISGFADIASDDFGANTGGNVAIYGDLGISIDNSTGVDASVSANGSASGDVLLNTLSGQTITISAISTAAVYSFSGSVYVNGGHLVVASNSGITAGEEIVIGNPLGTGGINLGSATDASPTDVEVSDVELDRMTAPAVRFSTDSGDIEVSQPMSRATGELELMTTTGGFTFTAPGALSAPELTFTDNGSGTSSWIITGTTVEYTSGEAIPYSGVTTLTIDGGNGDDSFDVTPAATTDISIVGGNPTVAPGDTLSVDVTGTTGAALTVESTPTGYQGAYTFSNRGDVAFQGIETLAEPSVNVSITKTDGQTTDTPGTSIDYTIVVTGAAPMGAAVTVADTFPATLSNVSWTCTPTGSASCTTANGMGNINQVVTVGDGETVTFAVSATIAPSAAGTLSNTATITVPDGASDVDTGDNAATDQTTLVAEADISVTKTDSPDPVGAAANLTYTITVTNNGPSDSQNVSLSDPIPANTTFVSLDFPSPFGCLTPPVGGTGTVDCSATTLTPGSYVFTLVVQADDALVAGSIITNSATATGTTTDPNGVNNTAETTTTSTYGIADLSVEKTTPWRAAAPGAEIPYTITITNNGPAIAENVVATDSLPAGATLVSVSPDQGTCSGTTTITCNVGNMLSGAVVSIDLRLTMPSELGDATNSVSVTTDSDDPTGANDSAAAIVEVVIAVPALQPGLLALLALALGAAGLLLLRRF